MDDFGPLPAYSYDAVADEFKGPCVRGTLTTTPAADAPLVRFAHPFTADEVARLAGVTPGRRARFGIGATSSIAEGLEAGPNEIALYYGVEYVLARDTIDAGTIEPLVNPLPTACGAGYAAGIVRGAQLLVEYRLEFASAEDAQAFRALAGAAPAAWHVSGVLAANAARFRGGVHQRFAMKQIGGDPTQLISVASGDDLTACWMNDAAACARVLAGTIAYAVGHREHDLPTTAPAHPSALGYLVAPYPTAIAPPSVSLPDGFYPARAALLTLFDAQSVVAHAARAALGFTSSVEEYQRIDAVREKADTNVSVVRAAAGNCYDVWRYGMTFEEGLQACIDGASADGLAAAGFDATVSLASLDAAQL